MTNKQKRLVFLATPPILELDLVGALSVFQNANYLLKLEGKEPFYQIEVVTTQNKDLIQGDCGLSLVANSHLEELISKKTKSKPIDTLLIVGGSGSVQVQLTDMVVNWLQSMSKKIRRIGSICTGAFVLAAAGLLNNRRATTHWAYCDKLLKTYPDVKVDNNPIFIKDGNIYTSAGVTTGMDLSLELVEEDLGSSMALEIARSLVIFLRRPGGQNQFSVTLKAATPERNSLRELPSWILEHIAEDLSVEVLANQAAMSLRHFARVFAAEFGVTPAHYVLAQRVEAARRALVQTKLGQKEIALKCGFGNVEHMRRAFLRITKVAPSTYRNHFHEKLEA